MKNNIYRKLYNALKDEPRPWIGTTEVAKIIRFELKTNFPGCKFSVRSEHFAGGSSVNVNWEDGPTIDEVEEKIGHLRGRGFDGMIDMSYYYNHHLTPTGITVGETSGTVGSAGSVPAWQEERPKGAITVSLSNGFLSTCRSHSDGLICEALEEVNEKFGWSITLEQYKQGMILDNLQYRETQSAVYNKSAYIPPASPEKEAKSQNEQEGALPSFSVVHDRDWTWITFENRIPQWASAVMRELGARFSGRRVAWYIREHVTETDISRALFNAAATIQEPA